jgi:hypothetical protein
MDILDLIMVVVGAIAAGYGAWRGFSIGRKRVLKEKKGKTAF